MSQSLQVLIELAARSSDFMALRVHLLSRLITDMSTRCRRRDGGTAAQPWIRLIRCNEKAEGFEKCRRLRQMSNRVPRRSTIHLRSFLLPSRDLRSLKYLRTAQPRAQRWPLRCPIGSQRRCIYHLLYLAADHQVVSTALALGENAQTLEEHALFQLPPTPANSPLAFEIAPDGKRLLFAAPVGRASAPITVLVNWQAELGKEAR